MTRKRPVPSGVVSPSMTLNSYADLFYNFNLIALQFVWDIAVTVLGLFWSCWPGLLWLGWHQELYSLLGTSDVRILFSNQYYCVAQHVDCHDVKFVSNHFGESRRWVEIRSLTAVDELLWGWGHYTTTLQSLPQYENVEKDSWPQATFPHQELHGRWLTLTLSHTQWRQSLWQISFNKTPVACFASMLILTTLLSLTPLFVAQVHGKGTEPAW